MINDVVAVAIQLEVSKDECLSLQSLSRTSQEKEHHWSRELSQTSAQLRLAQERVEQLEREARGREGAVRELQVKLESAQCTQAARQEEVHTVNNLYENHTAL